MGESACAHTTLPIFLSSNQSTPQTIYNMAASNVGNSSLYEAGDQRNPPDSEKAENQATPYEEGKSNSHDQNDPKTMTKVARTCPRRTRLPKKTRHSLLKCMATSRQRAPRSTKSSLTRKRRSWPRRMLHLAAKERAVLARPPARRTRLSTIACIMTAYG